MPDRRFTRLPDTAPCITAATLRMGLGALLLTVPISAAAQQPTQAQANAIRQSCRSDYQSYCA
ncbi:MAG TPA: hypothetical protein VMB73_17870, partial [Acetobacteraceae bacterium]|nr:hypothetical protein [Acetobacteraceae bacterium]